LKLVFIGTWIADSHNATSKKGTFDDIEQYILSQWKDFAAKDEVEYDPDSGRYCHTQSFEDNSGVMKIIDQYDEDTFWESLIRQLAMRDFRKQYGEDKIKAMELEEIFEANDPFVKKYEDEIFENALRTLFCEVMR
jgi:hypothetical protein